jgi:DNA-binding response OmpR family regulator
MMPRKSGIDALRELREAGIDTPALIVSAHTDGGNGADHSDLGISGYIAKPIDFDQLFKKITELTS